MAETWCETKAKCLKNRPYSSLDKDGNLDKEEVDIGNLGIVVNISEEGAASDVTNAAV